MRRVGLVLLLSLGAAGCLGSAAPVPSDHFYRAVVPAPAPTAQGARFDGVVVVNPLKANTLLRERAVAYSLIDRQHVIQQHNYHYWADPPPQLLQRQLADFLREADFADRVVLPDRRRNPDFEVDGRIRRLERVIGRDRVMVAVELEIMISRERNGETIFAGLYKREVEVPDSRVDTSIRAINKALGEIYARFVSEAGRTLTAQAKPEVE